MRIERVTMAPTESTAFKKLDLRQHCLLRSSGDFVTAARSSPRVGKTTRSDGGGHTLPSQPRCTPASSGTAEGWRGTFVGGDDLSKDRKWRERTRACWKSRAEGSTAARIGECSTPPRSEASEIDVLSRNRSGLMSNPEVDEVRSEMQELLSKC